jgi:hypothetical protein
LEVIVFLKFDEFGFAHKSAKLMQPHHHNELR